ncbi:MAG: GNAT family protein [Betaproteobacteria bacterium]
MTEKPNPVLLDMPAELVGERIVLRPFRDDDAPALWEAVESSRPQLKAWMPWAIDHNSLEFSRDYVRRMQAKWILREDLPMGIWRAADSRLLGATGLHRIDWSIPAMEIGYWLRPDAVGTGYATEAVTLLTRLAFDSLQAERVEIRCDALNLRSAAVPRRLGFVHEATMRCARRNVNNELGDTLVFALTRADGASRQA